MQALKSKDSLTGILFMGLGGLILLSGTNLPMGTSASMGAGFFPTVVACGMLLLGIVLAARGILSGIVDPVPKVSWVPVFTVTAALIIFGQIVDRAGMVASIVLLMVMSAWADGDFRWRELVMLAAGASLFCWLVFIVGLGLPIPVWPR